MFSEEKSLEFFNNSLKEKIIQALKSTNDFCLQYNDDFMKYKLHSCGKNYFRANAIQKKYLIKDICNILPSAIEIKKNDNDFIVTKLFYYEYGIVSAYLKCVRIFFEKFNVIINGKQIEISGTKIYNPYVTDAAGKSYWCGIESVKQTKVGYSVLKSLKPNEFDSKTFVLVNYDNNNELLTTEYFIDKECKHWHRINGPALINHKNGKKIFALHGKVMLERDARFLCKRIKEITFTNAFQIAKYKLAASIINNTEVLEYLESIEIANKLTNNL